MKKRKFTEQQIAFALKQADLGTSVGCVASHRIMAAVHCYVYISRRANAMWALSYRRMPPGAYIGNCLWLADPSPRWCGRQPRSKEAGVLVMAAATRRGRVIGCFACGGLLGGMK